MKMFNNFKKKHMDWKFFFKEIATGAVVGITAVLVVDGVEAVTKAVTKAFK